MSQEQKELLKKYKDTILSYTGTRFKDKKDTKEICTKVGVKKKKPLSEIEPDQILPEEVDVVEVPEIKLQNTNQNRHRPLIGGISGIVENSTAATLGLLVRDNTSNNIVGLTNNHCLGSLYDPDYHHLSNGNTSIINKKFWQPSPYDSGTINDTIGLVLRAIPFKCGPDTPPNYVDCGVLSIFHLNNSWFSIHNISSGPFGFLEKIQYNVDDQVIKSGRTTGVTTGTIFTKDMTVNVTMGDDPDDYALFEDQIGIFGPGVSAGGDSGSVVLKLNPNTNKYDVIGLLFAGGQMDGEDIAILNHISDVSNYLDISPWNGNIVLLYDSPDEVTINGVVFEKINNTTNHITHVV
ncbi:MAG: hypothetical protein ACOCZ5_00870 [bacterium]